MPKKTINKQVEEVLDQEPKTSVKRPNVAAIKEEYHQCLAEAYASKEWRDYMENLISALITDSAFHFYDIEDLRFIQGKIIGLKELLIRSKRAFEMGAKIQKLSEVGKKHAA